MSKGTGSYKALASRPKAAARGCHNVTLVQDVGKHIPGGLPRKADPDVGGVLTTVHAEAHVFEGFAQDGGVFLVVADQVQHCIIPFVLRHNVQKSDANTNMAKAHLISGAVMGGQTF